MTEEIASTKPLQGKTALITGGSRGIGRATALALARAGCRVAVSYRQQHAEAQQVVHEIESMGSQAVAVQADLSQTHAAAVLIESVVQQLGPLDVLVNNAGVGTRVSLADLDVSLWEQTIATNLTSAFLLSQAVLPAMRERRWGRLIFLSSVAAQTGGVIGPHYAASKAGMLGLMHSYANLLAKEGVTSNAIAPALIHTEMITSNAAATPSLIPMGRFGAVEEVADAVVFLSTNGYITGQTLSLNGGWYMT